MKKGELLALVTALWLADKALEPLLSSGTNKVNTGSMVDRGMPAVTVESMRTVEVTATPEGPEALARGRLLDKNGQPTGQMLNIIGTEGFEFLIYLSGKVYRVPMEQMAVTEGYPWKEVITDKRLGVRLDKWQFADRVRLVGAENVRVAGPTENLGVGSSDFERMLTEADKQGLGMLVVFNPTYPRADSYYQDKLEVLLRSHPRTRVQLGNEPDNTAPNSRFWQGNWESFGHFAAVSINKIRQINKTTEIVIAATVTPEKFETVMLDALVRAGVDLTDPNLVFAIHTYHTVEDVGQRIGAMRAILSKYGVTNPRLVISEMGVYTGEGEANNLLAMTVEAYRLGVEQIYIHEYLNWEGYGLVAPDWSRLSPLFWKVAAAVRMGWRW